MNNDFFNDDNFLNQDENEVLSILYPQNTSVITYEDLLENSKLLNVKLSDEFLKQMFKEADVNFDNKLSR